MKRASQEDPPRRLSDGIKPEIGLQFNAWPRERHGKKKGLLCFVFFKVSTVIIHVIQENQARENCGEDGRERE